MKAGPRVHKLVFCAFALVLFLLFALVVGDADYHGTPVGWVPFLAMVIGLGLAGAYLAVAGRMLNVSDQAREAACKRGEQVSFSVTFDNRAPLFLFWVDAVFFVGDVQGNRLTERATTLSLSPFEKHTMTFQASFEHIGRYEAGLERVVVHDFLNLFTYTLESTARSEVLVEPNLVTIGAIRFSEESRFDDMKATRAVLADSMDYAFVRPYVVGDPLKTIHWKLSARSGSYQTRLFERYPDPGVSVVLDFSSALEDAEERRCMLDAVVECGLSVARHALQEGLDVDIRWCDRDGNRQVLRGWSDEDAAGFVCALPQLSPDAGEFRRTREVLHELASGLEGQGNVVVCSANLDRDMAGAVVELKAAQREPRFIAAVPSRLVDRDREHYCENLHMLEDAGIECVAVSSARELAAVGL